MTRYNYELQTTEVIQTTETEGTNEPEIKTISKVQKTVKETFPDLDVLERGLKVGRNTETIKKTLKKAYEGKAQEFIIQIEEDWFKIVNEIQQLEDKDSDDIFSSTEKIVFNEDTQEQETIVTEVKVQDKLNELQELLEQKETRNEWLKAYRGIETDAQAPEIQGIIPSRDTKKLIAHERDLKVRNSEDSIADLAKMNALLMSFVTAIYAITPDEAKDNLPEEQKAIIDYATSKWAETQTRGDRQLKQEGTALIDKLFQREVEIADIIDNIKD